MISEEIEATFLDKDREVLVGLSGGPDSLCLTHQLLENHYTVVAAYFNHRLRPGVEKEVQFVRERAEAWGIPFVQAGADVRSYAQERSTSIEDAARTLRYNFLFTQAENRHAQAVAVGHTADDQVETVLLHLIRGAGIQGLTGMSSYSLPNPWSETIPLVRPLLSVWGDEVMAYCHQHGLSPLSDPSNRELAYRRNQIRHQVIPLLEEINPNVKEGLWQLAEILKGDFTILQDRTRRLWKELHWESGEDYIALSLSGLRKLEIGDQRRLLRRAMQALLPSQSQVSFHHVEKVRRFVRQPGTEVDSLVAQLEVEIREDVLYVHGAGAAPAVPSYPQLSGGRMLVIEGQGEYALEDGWVLDVERVPIGESELEVIYQNPDRYQVWLDAGKVRYPLTVGGRRRGERFQPLGMEGEIKVSNLMINEKIPAAVRDDWPILRSQGETVWVPGCRMAHFARLTEETEGAFHLSLHKKST